MKTFVIRQRVADFLKRHAPFDSLSEVDLLELAGSGRVKFHESEEYVFREGDAKAELVWMIQQGRVELLEQSAAGEQLRDLLGEGDVVGLERFTGDGSCQYSARTATDVILYGVSAELFEALVPRYPAVKRFVSAHVSVAGILGFGRTSWLDSESPPAEFLRSRLVTLPLDASTAQAASRLAAARNRVAAFIDEHGCAAGILTPMALCQSQNGHARTALRPLAAAMSLPVTIRAAVREMLRTGSEELAITRDGTLASALEAILTGDDLAVFCGHNPVRLASAIRQAGSAAEIAPLLLRARRLVMDGLAQPHHVDDCCAIGMEVADAVADACVRMAGSDVAERGFEPPEAAFCSLAFGAGARGDLLIPELPAVAAVYDDLANGFRIADRVYFAALAGDTAARLYGCGLVQRDWLWPEGSQPSMPLSEWQRFYRETIQNPVEHDLYSRREFFDLRPVDPHAAPGEIAMVRELQEHILAELRQHPMLIALLANDTLAHLPPLTFFEGLVLDLDGGRRDSFDIAGGAIIPITDAARVFAIARHRLSPSNTLARLQSAMLDFPGGADILRDAAEALRIALYYQTLAGGPHIGARTLGKFDQRLLKTAFSSIQRLLEFTASTFMPGTI